mmetsp:Transcript_10044/g.40916  ORF Transcript_10044/g.40916 Transcript_10044/m.40916 type:complete len:571 (+) Transcript_10044:803-2515(+)
MVLAVADFEGRGKGLDIARAGHRVDIPPLADDPVAVHVDQQVAALGQLQVFEVRVVELQARGHRGQLFRLDQALEAGRGHRRADKLDRQRTLAGGLVVAAGSHYRVVGIRVQVGGPAAVDVAGQHHDVVDLGVVGVALDARKDAVACRLIAVPLVAVQEEQARVVLVRAWRLELGEHHALAEQLPARRRGAQAVDQPGLFGVAQQRAAGVAVAGVGRRKTGAEDRVVHRRRELFGAGVDALFQHQQVGEVAVGEAAVVVTPVVHVDRAHRHPLVIGLQGRGDAGVPVAFGGRLVVLGAALPAVVGGFVVVPDRDQRMLAVHGLGVGVALVLGVALAVVGQRDDLVGRLGRAHIAVLAGAVFVDVVAQVHDQVEVGPRRDAPVGIEIAVGVVGAADDREAQAGHIRGRQRLGAADRAGRTLGAELVVVGRAGLQAGGVDLDRVVAAGVGLGAAALHDLGERRVGGDHIGHGHGRLGGCRRHTRPQDDAVGERVAAGHAVLEDGVHCCFGRQRQQAGRGHQRGGAGTGALEEVAAAAAGPRGLDFGRTTHAAPRVSGCGTGRNSAAQHRWLR